jgi:hypothetical protein
MLCKKILAVYSGNHAKQIQNAQLLIAKSGGTHSSHWACHPLDVIVSVLDFGPKVRGFKPG